MYSPNGKYMAAALYDTYIDVYSVDKGYAKLCRCTGHSATVSGIDWSTDSSIIMSNSNDSELLFWNGRTGKQARERRALNRPRVPSSYLCFSLAQTEHTY